MHVLDTNAIIYYLKDDKNAALVLDEIFQNDSRIYVSSITEMELFSFSGLDFENLLQIEEFLKLVNVISVDSQIARHAGYLKRNFKVPSMDSIIAATAFFTDSVLVTRNVKDFKNISGIRLMEV